MLAVGVSRGKWPEEVGVFTPADSCPVSLVEGCGAGLNSPELLEPPYLLGPISFACGSSAPYRLIQLWLQLRRL